ncbi:MAG: O-antigen ligase family protein [Pseudomonadota bacterium]
MSLDVVMGAMPSSLNVEATHASVGYVLTPLFVILLCVRIGLSPLQRIMPAFFCQLGAVFALVGLSQIYVGHEGFLYLYENTNIGAPVGTFANVNHFASLLLMISPFAVYLVAGASARRRETDQTAAMMLMIYSCLLLLTVGIAAAGSLAIYFLSIPIVSLALVATRANTFEGRGRMLSRIAVASIVILGASIVWNSPVLNGLGLIGSDDDPTSRQNMWSFTIAAIQEYWPIGSGMGTYESVIPHFENPDEVTSRYIALAHNEYLQLAMEMGAAGVVIAFTGATWLIIRARAIWFGGDSNRTQIMRKMAFLGILVCCSHSIVDYPARTPAIASVLAVYVALVSLPQVERSKPKNIKVQSDKRRVL